MARFKIGYTREEAGYYFFDAQDAEHAQKLLDKIGEGELYIEDLPNFYEKLRDGGSDFVGDLEIVE